MDGKTTVVPTNTENYISFTKYMQKSVSGVQLHENIKLTFIDSFRFMAASLSQLASLLPSSEKKILWREFENEIYSPEQIRLLERKGVFPYDYVTCNERLDETSLPARHHFYNKLNDEEVSTADYEFACDIWRKFNINTLREYSDLYLKTDVLLLSDIFENFRDTCVNTYGLDPSHYLTASSFSFDAMLKYTNVNIELLTDIEMLLFVEKGIRGGVSQASQRHIKANNKYMGDKYNPQEKTKYLMYLDANNLYGYAMSQPIPIGEYEWVNRDKEPALFIDVNAILELSDSSETGFIFEVSLHYPNDLHQTHNDMPFCPEKCPLPAEVYDILDRKPSKIEKLLLTFYDKENYVIHFQMLKLALRHGLKLKKVHRILKFKQTPWLKPYIDLNTDLRQKAKDKFKQTLYKLFNNVIFGKSMENVRLHVDISLVHDWIGMKGARMLIARPNFKRCKIFSENLVAIEMKRTQIFMNKPIIIGMCILDVSKITMYTFLYDFLKPLYGDKVLVAYTDTDSFVLVIETPDFYQDIKANIERFDTSDYPLPNPYGIERMNKKVPGLMKDELNGKVMIEFVALRAKCYAVRSLDDAETINEKMKKAKGIKKNVLQRQITFDDYVKCITDSCEISRTQNTIRSIKHKIYSIKQRKIALSPFDDKRYILENSSSGETLAWNHNQIDRYEFIRLLDKENKNLNNQNK